MAPNHHIWGRQLEDYTDSYCFIGYQKPLLDSEDKLNSFLETVELGINQLSEFGLKGDLDCIPATQITLSTLQTVVALEFSPHALHHLASPLLIQGCVKLASTVKQGNQISPFSYEYGYLCFRIMALAISVCLLDRANKLDSVTDGMKSVPDEQIILILNEEITALITDKLKDRVDGLGFDEILGWSCSSTFEPMLSASDASLLLAVLWADRKWFMEAVAMTEMPGLAGLMLALWRHWRIKEKIHPEQAGEVLLRLSDVFWRYCCIINELEDSALSIIHLDIAAPAEEWLPRTQAVDLDDSRSIINSYIGRVEPFKPGSESDHEPIVVSLASALLRFVVSRVQPGVEDLFPSLFKATIECIWDDVIYGGADHDQFIVSMVAIFLYFSQLLGRFSLPESIKLELVEVIVNCNLIDLTATLILILRPLTFEIKEYPNFERDPSMTTVKILYLMYQRLSETLPKEFVEERFDNTFFDWLNFRLYLLWRVEFTDVSDSDPTHDNLRIYSDLWDKVGSLMGHHHKASSARLITFNCGYCRCPDPSALLGARFQCEKCATPYCSAICQTLDWKHGHGANGRSHKGTCMCS